MKEIIEIAELKKIIQHENRLHNVAVRDIDLTEISAELKGASVSKVLFLGCTINDSLMVSLVKENLVFPSLDMPFDPYLSRLYTGTDLYQGFDRHRPETYNDTPDAKIYNHYKETKDEKGGWILETLARRIHDYSITDALVDELQKYDEKKVAAIMGGHSLLRSDQNYYKAALISKKLCERGYLMLSGGGPGAMEATHLGAWFAHKDEAEVKEAIAILKKGDSYRDELWLSAAFEVMERFPRKDDTVYDIGIPTWHYGHEPPTPLASRIAKYFNNSVREEGLLAYAKGGIIYTPGSAGTIQEIFQDAAQNHYKSYDYASPMVFLGKEYWTKDKPVYETLKSLAKDYDYGELISISDEVDEIVEIISSF